MAIIRDRIVDKIETRRFGHGVGEDLDMITVLGRTAAAVVVDPLRIRLVIMDKSEIFDWRSLEWDVLYGHSGWEGNSNRIGLKMKFGDIRQRLNGCWM